ncbi:hypothetical protein I4U23_020126 [Adineta vaga]|nr:hypothetical protein I4U23_020126 [Adineta vaga]
MVINSQLLTTIAASLFGITCAIFITSNALRSWSQNEYLGGLQSDPSGRVCGNISCPSKTDKTNLCAKILAARAFITLTCIISAICAAFLLYKFASKVTNEKILLIIKVLAFLCLVMSIIGVSVSIPATTLEGSSSHSFGLASIIAIIGLIINLVGAVITLFIQ